VTKPLSDFLTLVRPKLPGCPQMILEEAIRESAIEFSKRTRLLDGQININTVVGSAVNIIDGDSTREDAAPVIPLPEPVEYCPGYEFTYVNATTFKIVGINVTSLFNVSRRLKFSIAGVDIYGSITSSIFSVDTTIVMTMEDSEVLLNEAYTVCLVTGILGWSPLPTAVMGGLEMSYLATGTVGAEEYFIGVGKAGSIVYSIDGTTWTAVVSSPTVNDIIRVIYAPSSQSFIISDSTGDMYYSEDGGATWAAVSVTGLSAQGDSSSIDVRGGLLYAPANGGLYWLDTDTLAAGAWGSNGNPDGLTNASYLAVEGNTYHAIGYSSGDDLIIRSTSADTGIDTTFDTNATFVAGNTVSAMIQAITHGLLCLGTNGNLFYTLRAHPAGTFILTDGGFTGSNINAGIYSEFLSRYIVVGDDGKLAYSDDFGVTWTQVSNGFNLENIQCITYNEGLKLFVAGGANGTICTSTIGVI
jgi:photosystem II stability/assembly factor-like uncharacterized protein